MGKLCRCGAIVEKRCTRCNPLPVHKKTTAERGYGSDWRLLSERKRLIDPMCEECLKQGRVTPAKHVHHIIPIADAPHLRLELSNLMSVCIECHKRLEATRRTSHRGVG